MLMLTAEQFEKSYADHSGMSVAELRAFGYRVLACNCAEDGCDGWKLGLVVPDAKILRDGVCSSGTGE